MEKRWGATFILLSVQNIDLEEVWLFKINYSISFHRDNYLHAKILPVFTYHPLPSLVAPAPGELPFN